MMGNQVATAHPGDAIIGGVRGRLLSRLFREVDAANHLFPSYRACIEAVVFEEGMFDAQWLDEFLPRPPVSEPFIDLETLPPPRGKVGGHTLQELWQLHLAQLMEWGQRQPWGWRGDGVEGLICDTYVESVKLWPDAGDQFHYPPDRTTASAFEWMTWILQHVARWRNRSRVVPLTIDPAEVVIDGSFRHQTMTSVPDREEIARRVRSLAALFADRIPDLETRLGAGGTLPLLLVADQLEVAAALPPAGRTMWSLQTIAGRTVPQIAAALDLTENNVRVQLSNARTIARENLVELWLPHAPPPPPRTGSAGSSFQPWPATPPAPGPEGTADE